ncbi:MAG: 30S ribosomal protein S1 [Candidatus Nealsonbacteria bacterium RIFOXYB1_FULL_40_15]|uniref:30S ribosomal protein S1 n=2 Tax=Candidatus Nealsoniibacteriota TaxID=1817911 RepID=A0A1G2EN12_9BACT|nr:MAG: 30S ribosomal protein S1 [Candidatus Nealsonbacteria bacterium RIFOXYC1_FULL_40_7]OGZ26894.1 MAG: 30S ribosomal protein S1 [Candidatus Nealsonbacteria bacterium RIFOXYB1_FULL_40_15]OGZ29319.1 MAG: 30S ribosomal protein S1 [Candidatus Nealsonbacteria bacterium RIFOXYD1_FULL_39_11]
MEKETEEKEKNIIRPLKVGDILSGKIIDFGMAAVYVDLGVLGTGVVYGKEFYEAKEKLKEHKIGDDLFVKVTGLENDDGYVEISATKAGKELAWETLREKREKDETIIVKILGANKGGLLAKVSDIQGFLPVSQLSPANYPKVEGGDSQKILKALQKFIGKELEVKVFDFNQKEEKLIFSEKAKEDKKIKSILENYKAGDIVEAEITGIIDFGAFVKIPIKTDDDSIDGLEGLIHISELDWQLIEDPAEIVKMGEKVQAKIIDISNGKVSLSLKALKEDPWKEAAEKFKKGDIIEGEVTKFNPFGAFVQITSKVQGLCHISEFGSQKKMEETLQLGKKYKFSVLLIDPAEHRITLKLES